MEEGARPITLDQTRSFIGDGAAAFVARMRAARGLADEAQDRLLASFVASYETAVERTHPYPGVPQVLAALCADGYRLGVCTNKPIRATRAVLAHLRLERYFVSVLGGDSLSVRKPDAGPLLAALRALNATPGTGVYVGDSEVDAETARRAGVPFLLFSEGYRKSPVDTLPHAALFDNYEALPALLRSAIP